MPSILLEYLFIDHVKENALLSSSKYRKFLGRTTADAIANAFDLKKKNDTSKEALLRKSFPFRKSV